jgi:hypothetical protein
MGDTLFGSSGSTSTSQIPTYTPEQTGTSQHLGSIVANALQTGGVYEYPTSTVSGSGDVQNQQYGYISNLLSGNSGSSQAYDNIMKEYSPTDAQNWWSSAVVQPATDYWENTLKPSVQESYAGYDATDSSGSRNALSKAGTDLTTQLGSILSNAVYKDKNTDTQNKLSAMNYPLNLISALNTPGTTQQTTQTNLLTDQYNRWNAAQSYNNPWLKYLETVLGNTGSQTVSSQTSGQKGQLGSLMGGAAALGGLFA